MVVATGSDYLVFILLAILQNNSLSLYMWQ